MWVVMKGMTFSVLQDMKIHRFSTRTGAESVANLFSSQWTFCRVQVCDKLQSTSSTCLRLLASKWSARLTPYSCYPLLTETTVWYYLLVFLPPGYKPSTNQWIVPCHGLPVLRPEARGCGSCHEGKRCHFRNILAGCLILLYLWISKWVPSWKTAPKRRQSPLCCLSVETVFLLCPLRFWRSMRIWTSRLPRTTRTTSVRKRRPLCERCAT